MNLLKTKNIIVIIFLGIHILLSMVTYGREHCRRVTFTNRDSENAKDLHISVDPIPKRVAISGCGYTGGNCQINGNQISATSTRGCSQNQTVTIRFYYDDDDIPQLGMIYWTKNGSSTWPNGPHDDNVIRCIRDPHDDKQKVDFSMQPSTGDGIIEITILGEAHSFYMPSGVPGDEMAVLFSGFIINDLGINVDTLIANTVTISSDSLSGWTDDFIINVIPDSTQEVTVTYLGSFIPTLTQWGVAILTLLVLAIGMAFVYRRQASLALAGEIDLAVSNTKPVFFDWKLLSKVFAVMLFIGIIVLLIMYRFNGNITGADPAGIFVSAAIVAYMVQLWILRKPEKRQE